MDRAKSEARVKRDMQMNREKTNMSLGTKKFA